MGKKQMSYDELREQAENLLALAEQRRADREAGDEQEEVAVNIQVNEELQDVLATNAMEDVLENTASQETLEEEIEAALALSTQNEGEEHTMYTTPSLLELVEQSKARQELNNVMPKKLKKTVRNNSRNTMFALLVMSMAEQFDTEDAGVVERIGMVEDLAYEGGIDPEAALQLIADLFVTEGIKFLEVASKFNTNSIGRVMTWVVTGDAFSTNEMKRIFKKTVEYATTIASYNTQVLATYSDERDLKALREKLANHLGKELNLDDLTKAFIEFASEKEQEALSAYQKIDEPTVVEVLPPTSGPFAPKQQAKPTSATEEPIEVSPVNFTMVEPATVPVVREPQATPAPEVAAEQPTRKPKAPSFFAKMCDFELKYA